MKYRHFSEIKPSKLKSYVYIFKNKNQILYIGKDQSIAKDRVK